MLRNESSAAARKSQTHTLPPEFLISVMTPEDSEKFLGSSVDGGKLERPQEGISLGGKVPPTSKTILSIKQMASPLGNEEFFLMFGMG